MNTLASSRLRVVALAGFLLVAVAGLGVTMLSHNSTSDTSVPTSALPTPAKHATTTPSKPATKPSTHTATIPAPAPTKPARPVVPAKPKLQSDLPAPLVRALAHHRVVVVAVGVGGSAVDAESRGEAKVGATLAGSGFLAVNVGNERDAKQFEPLLNSDLNAPAVLVVKRPGKVFVRFDGFADRELVAQAAANAGS
jgi:hypothetical protein